MRWNVYSMNKRRTNIKSTNVGWFCLDAYATPNDDEKETTKKDGVDLFFFLQSSLDLKIKGVEFEMIL